MKDFREFLCNGCKAVIAMTDGEILLIGDVSIAVSLPFLCMKCGHKHVWRPVTWEGKSERRYKKRMEQTTYSLPKSSSISAAVDAIVSKRMGEFAPSVDRRK